MDDKIFLVIVGVLVPFVGTVLRFWSSIFFQKSSKFKTTKSI